MGLNMAYLVFKMKMFSEVGVFHVYQESVVRSVSFEGTGFCLFVCLFVFAHVYLLEANIVWWGVGC